MGHRPWHARSTGGRTYFARRLHRFAPEVVIGVAVKRVIGITGMGYAHGGISLFGPSHSPRPGASLQG